MSLRQRTRYSHYRGHQILSHPDVEPISVEELQDHLRLDSVDTSEIALLNLYIAAAREQCEEVTGRALITQTWRLTLDAWPHGREPWWDGVRQVPISELRSSSRPSWVIVPRYSLQSVERLAVFDFDGQPEEIDVEQTFIVDTEQEPGRLVLRNTATWPVALQRANAIEIDYKAGYGDTPHDVPAPLRLALLQMAAHLYEYRGDQCSAEDAMSKSGAGAVFRRYAQARV